MFRKLIRFFKKLIYRKRFLKSYRDLVTYQIYQENNKRLDKSFNELIKERF